MPSVGTYLLLAATFAAPAPARPKDPWVGTIVCLKSAGAETYRRTAEGEFELHPHRLRYLDLRVVEEKGDFVAVENDETVVWVKKEIALRPRDSIDYFTAQLDKDPTDQRALSCRCASYMAAGEHDRALKDAEEAVRMNPGSSAWRNNRGEVLIKKKEYGKALAEFTALLDEAPDHDFALMNRGEVYVRTRQFDKAMADLTAALKRLPNVPVLHMNVARCLATSPDPKLRDGKKAVEAAGRALDLFKFKDGRLYDTAAAAYAAAGEFDRAVVYQQKAIDDADFMRDDGPGARKRLQLYRDKKDFKDE